MRHATCLEPVERPTASSARIHSGIHASGQDTAGAMFFSRGEDGGQTWTRLPQPLSQFDRPYDLNLLLVSDASPVYLGL